MTTTALALPEPERLAHEARSWPDRARDLDVTDDETYEFASAMILGIKELRQQIEIYHAPLKEAAHRAHRKICDAERGLLAPLVEADGIVVPKITAFLQRKEQERRIQEAQAREAQRRIEDEQRAAEARSLQAAGESEAAAQLLASPPPPAPPVVIPPSGPKTGIGMRTTWKARVTDVRALCAAIGDGRVPVSAIEVKQGVLDAQARVLKSEMHWPGTEAYEETGIVRKG